jgi:imidazolonepropionase-like amidohydrolase
VLLALAAAASAEEPSGPQPIALVGGRIVTMAGTPIEGGTVVITGRKVSAVGSGVAIPEGAQQVDVHGMTVLPGLIDALSRLYIYPQDLAEATAIAPSLRASDGLDLFAEHTEEVLRHGVTAVHVAPGDRGLLAGLSAVVKVGSSPGAVDVVNASVAVRGQIGVPAGGSTASLVRLGDYASIRQALLSARDYLFEKHRYERRLAAFERKVAETQEKGEGGATAAGPTGGPPGGAPGGPGGGRGGGRGGGPGSGPPGDGGGRPGGGPPGERPDRPQKPPTDPNSEVLGQVLAGEIPLLLEAHRVPDILNALRLKDEFGIRLVLLGATEGYKVAGEIAKRGVPVVVAPVSTAFSSATRLRLGDHTEANAALLDKAGVEVVLGVGGDSGLASKFVRAAAARAVAGGMNRDHALAGVTSTAARVLGVADRIGAIAEGRDADVVVIAGDPLDPTAPVAMVFMGGKLVYQREAAK